MLDHTAMPTNVSMLYMMYCNKKRVDLLDNTKVCTVSFLSVSFHVPLCLATPNE